MNGLNPRLKSFIDMRQAGLIKQPNGVLNLDETNRNGFEFLNALKLLNQCLKQSNASPSTVVNANGMHGHGTHDESFNRIKDDRIVSDRYMCYEEWKQAALVIDR